MRISIHQPHYLPWLPLVYKIIMSDVFVSLDHVNYSKNDWINRNKLKNASGSFILTIPIKKHSSKKISDMIYDGDKWKKKHLKSFYYNYNATPYFNDIFPFLEKIYYQECTNVSKLNYRILEWIIQYLNSDVKIIRSSDLCLSSSKNELLIDICKTVGAKEYIVGSYGYKNYLDHNLFSENGIDIQIMGWNCPKYKQGFENIGFIQNLSVFDLLLNHGPHSKSILLQGGNIF
ncbi:WbqC family protein [Bacillus cereus]|nr:WbqC family protein [Bacillus cereus]MDA2079898.1 WbqC family protein [Bacillus cereus]MDA2085488.1 WbqC family protein [Bacillus cereus]MDA2178590.1 WbqC family protein [Bacillus cereus]